MGIRSTTKNALFLAVGAAATSIEALTNAAEYLVERGEKVVLRGKTVLSDFCAKHFSDDAATVIVEEDPPKDEKGK